MICYWCSKDKATSTQTAWHNGVAFTVDLHVKKCKAAWWEDAKALGTVDEPPVAPPLKIKRKVRRPKTVAS